MSWVSQRVRCWVTGSTSERGQKGGVQREEGRVNARKEWKVRKKECSRLKQIKNERCSKEKVREGRKSLTEEEFETEEIEKARRNGGEKKGERT